jgi:uncharacterized protein YgbK (DUF1537 family)
LDLPTAPPIAPIYLLADDLTGACDAAAAFLRCGRPVRVWVGSQAPQGALESVQAFNTDSRSLPPEEAAAAVASAVAALGDRENALLFKKIDSAARGPLAAEVLAAHQAFGTRSILLAPSFPANGRTVRDGILHLQDASNQRREVSLAELFPAEIQSGIALVRSPDRLPEAFESGKPILLCDATTQAELDALARAAHDLKGLLYAGSAGLAQAVASLHPASVAPEPLPVCARLLIVCGTRHPLTQLQLRNLELEGHSSVEVLRVEGGRKDEARIRAVFVHFNPQSILLTGGDTALLAARALGAHSFTLRGEFAPGIPWGRIEGGAANGRVVFTKSGGFGAANVLSEIFHTLTGTA